MLSSSLSVAYFRSLRIDYVPCKLGCENGNQAQILLSILAMYSCARSPCLWLVSLFFDNNVAVHTSPENGSPYCSCAG